jgi:pimeloyl-ACP methyl ester carboxylesterase
MPFVTSNGHSLYYDIVGEGPAVCLINGYRLSGAAWPPGFIPRLATRLSVISFDNRGTGRSDKPPAGYEFSNMAKDLVGLLDNLGLERVHLFGFSMGGAIAQEVAIRDADRIDRLILFGTFCGGVWAEPASYAVFRRLLAVENQSPEDAARQAWPVTYSPEYLAANGRCAASWSIRPRRSLRSNRWRRYGSSTVTVICRPFGHRHWSRPGLTTYW